MADDLYSTAGGATLRKWATTAAVFGVFAVGASLALDKLVQGGLPQIAIVRTDGSMTLIGGAPTARKGGPASVAAQASGVDTTAVGSIRIDPCTGQKK
ncbi:MAG: hypothetical protein IPL88_07905 [Rhizobiales bacterium]|nr:hypothetical protein [Hyphomicrobiales bacterium]